MFALIRLFVLAGICAGPLLAGAGHPPIDSSHTSQHEVTIKGKRIAYTATVGTQPVFGKDGAPVATLFYTYYQRSGVRNREQRPLLISFNGGPGSASVWMHLAYTGPYILNIDEEGYPLQPYGVRPNPHSILDVADIVFVNPVNTAFSRMVPQKDGKLPDKKLFFGVNADIKYLADWINTFVSRAGRWRSPKYLIGESYGTTRVSGLALELQNRQWMYLNGVILVSPTNLGIERDGPAAAALQLPYFTAAAWYHGRLPEALQKQDLEAILPEAERYSIEVLLPALARGGFLPAEERRKIAERLAYFSGIAPGVFLQHNLAMPASFFWKELLRDKGYTVGRLDSRYLGIDRKEAGERPDFNAELASWLHAFTPAVNYYLRDMLGYKTDVKYNMFGPVRPWDRSNDQTGENLRRAMAANPWLQVMIQSGYYDGATQYFNAKYTLWHLDPSGKMRSRLHFKGYRSGHMMYLRAEDLAAANEDIREFIRRTLPAKDEPAKYEVK